MSLRARDEQFLCLVARGHSVTRMAESTCWASWVSAVLTALSSEPTSQGGPSPQPTHTAPTLCQSAGPGGGGQGTVADLKGHRAESLCGFFLFPVLPPTQLLPFLLSGSGREWGLLELATLPQRP